MKRGYLRKGMLGVLGLAFVLGTWATSGYAQCRIDWNQDTLITEADYLVGDPMGGFYAEWYIHLYYPTYYPILFPTSDSAALDFNGDSVVDQDDLMGALDPVASTEGFYVEWYIWMFYRGYYPVFFPEFVTACENVTVVPSPASLPDTFYYDLDSEWFFDVSRDGSLIAGMDTSTFMGFVMNTTDFVANPGAKNYYQWMTGETVRSVKDISDDNNIVLAVIEMTIDDENVDGGAYYNRSTGVWTHLGAPEPGIDYGSCHFYPTGEGMSADGNLIYGWTPSAASPCTIQPFVYNVATDTWTVFDGVVPGETAKVHGGNHDGGLIYGWEQRDAEWLDGEIIHYGGRVPVLWTRQADGTYSAEWLGLDPPGEVYGCSFNGDYIVGTDYQMGTIWDKDGDLLVDMQKLAERSAMPFAVSDDGKITVGTHSAGLGTIDPFIRKEGYNGGQMTLIETYFTDHGITDLMNFAGGFTPASISSDGKVIIGYAGGVGVRKAWVAVVDPG